MWPLGTHQEERGERWVSFVLLHVVDSNGLEALPGAVLPLFAFRLPSDVAIVEQEITIGVETEQARRANMVVVQIRIFSGTVRIIYQQRQV